MVTLNVNERDVGAPPNSIPVALVLVVATDSGSIPGISLFIIHTLLADTDKLRR